MRFITEKKGLTIVLKPKKREYDRNGVLQTVPGEYIQFVNGIYDTKDEREIKILKKDTLVYVVEKDTEKISGAIKEALEKEAKEAKAIAAAVKVKKEDEAAEVEAAEAGAAAVEAAEVTAAEAAKKKADFSNEDQQRPKKGGLFNRNKGT